MSETRKFEDLTKKQQDTIKEAGKKFIIGNLLTGANYGGLLFVANLCLVLANGAFFNSTFLLIAAVVVVDIKLISMMRSTNRENAKLFSATVKQVLEEK